MGKYKCEKCGKEADEAGTCCDQEMKEQSEGTEEKTSEEAKEE